ncbi:hypothetical protein ACNFJ7_03560 [Sphingomonas sp. HT-1]
MLAADEASYITGAEFTIDGGLLAGSATAPGCVLQHSIVEIRI